VGASASRLVLGKHSGRHAVRVRLSQLGYQLSETELDEAFDRFKRLADKKKTITDPDLQTLVANQLAEPHEVYRLDGLQVGCGTLGLSTATVRLRGPDGAQVVNASVGTGPVDAAFKAIREIVGIEDKLLEYSVHSVTEGIDALGQVTVRISGQGSPSVHPQHESGQPRCYIGHGADTDIVVASAKAYLAALNKLLVARGAEALHVEGPEQQAHA
jgi:2-isopropylmalate synthase